MRALVLGLVLVFLFACQKKEDYIKVSCPSEKQLVEVLKKFNPELYIKIEKVQQFEKVPLCEVELWAGARYAILYTDPKAKYLFPTAFDASTGENVSAKKVSQQKNLPKDILEQFEKHVNFVVGDGKDYIYLITEPKNEKAEETYKNLLQWAKEKNMKIKIIVRPEDFNIEGYNTAISALCKKQSFDQMLKGYYDASADCKEGRATLDKNMKFVNAQMGLTFPNPIIITSNGKLWIGQLNKDQFEALLK
ncbi:MAG: hypothetical protein ACO2PP_25225 [Thermocrinis sp.]|jgi:effector-binding domain-containing protein|uniref:hypothetical protein n=1 Tax=Thermocrinis sp. TaxID=2024383 RepID=UPI003C0B5B81